MKVYNVKRHVTRVCGVKCEFREAVEQSRMFRFCERKEVGVHRDLVEDTQLVLREELYSVDQENRFKEFTGCMGYE